jgi:hypothetical protein
VQNESLADRPAVSEELGRCIVRLSKVRAEIRALETEEQLLRDALARSVGAWPDSWFPIRAEDRELRRHGRVGTIDAEAALQALTAAGLRDQVPTVMRVADAEAAREFPSRLLDLGIGRRTADKVAALFSTVVQPVPDVTAAWLEERRAAKAVDEDTYRACFRRGQPVVWVWTVR